MPYVLEWLDRGVVFRYSGVLSGEEMIRSNQDLYDDPRFKDLRFQIVDFLSVQHFDGTSADIRQIADSDSKAAQINSDMYVVGVTNQKIIHGFFRMYELASGASPWHASLCERMDEAIAWLRRELPEDVSVPDDLVHDE